MLAVEVGDEIASNTEEKSVEVGDGFGVHVFPATEEDFVREVVGVFVSWKLECQKTPNAVGEEVEDLTVGCAILVARDSVGEEFFTQDRHVLATILALFHVFGYIIDDPAGRLYDYENSERVKKGEDWRRNGGDWHSTERL